MEQYVGRHWSFGHPCVVCRRSLSLTSVVNVPHSFTDVVGIGNGHSVSALDVEAVGEMPLIAIDCMSPSSRANVET